MIKHKIISILLPQLLSKCIENIFIKKIKKLFDISATLFYLIIK